MTHTTDTRESLLVQNVALAKFCGVTVEPNSDSLSVIPSYYIKGTSDSQLYWSEAEAWKAVPDFSTDPAAFVLLLRVLAEKGCRAFEFDLLDTGEWQARFWHPQSMSILQGRGESAERALSNCAIQLPEVQSLIESSPEREETQP